MLHDASSSCRLEQALRFDKMRNLSNKDDSQDFGLFRLSVLEIFGPLKAAFDEWIIGVSVLTENLGCVKHKTVVWPRKKSKSFLFG